MPNNVRNLFSVRKDRLAGGAPRLPGPFRDKSEKYGLKVGLCGESRHRNGRYAAHQCRETSDALKQFWQIKYMMAHKASVADSGRHSGRTIWNSTTTMMKGATL